MSWRLDRGRTLTVIALVLCATVVMAAEEGAEPQTTPAPSPLEGSAVSDETPRVSRALAELAELQRAIELADRKLELAVLSRKLSDATRTAPDGTANLPVLVGIHTARGGALVAQYRVGVGVIDAQAGDWVTADWRLAAVDGAGAELIHRDGRQRFRSVLGGQSTTTQEATGMDPMGTTGAMGRMGPRSIPPTPTMSGPQWFTPSSPTVVPPPSPSRSGP